MASPIPSGTIAFTDIEGSSQRWDRDRTAMETAVRRHDTLMREAIAAHNPDNVLAFSCQGRVTKADYDTVFVPAVAEALKRHTKVRLYYETASDFTASIWARCGQMFRSGWNTSHAGIWLPSSRLFRLLAVVTTFRSDRFGSSATSVSA